MNQTANGEEKLLALSQQIDAILAGGPGILHCPYCGKVTLDGTQFCCATMIRACTVLFDARDKVASLRT